MNLKSYLLVRMMTLGLLCWIGIAGYVSYRTVQEVKQAIDSDGERLQELVEYSLYQRRIHAAAEGPVTLAGRQHGLLLAPYCLRYEGSNREVLREGCADRPQDRAAERMLEWLGLSERTGIRPVSLWGQPIGQLRITPEATVILGKFWNTLSDLLLLTALTLTSLAVLCYVVIGKALQPATQLVQQLDSIAVSEDNALPHHLADLQPREFAQIASGVNRLSERLRRLNDTRRALLRKLIHVQEEERREIAHLVHSDLGQTLSLVALHCAQLRKQLPRTDTQARDRLEQIELMIEGSFDKMRALLVNKCPPVSTGADLGIAIQDLCTRWELGADNRRKVDVRLQQDVLQALGKDQALCIYRTIEECLNNVGKHAHGSAVVSVSLRADGNRIEVAIVNSMYDDAASGDSVASGGMGLPLLAERVRVHGGELIVSREDHRFVVAASFSMEHRP